MTLRDRLPILATLGAAAVSAVCGRDPTPPTAPPAAFVVEEATIEGIHAAIRSGRTTCRAVVQAYIDRARGLQRRVHRVSSPPMAATSAPANGYVRAGAPLTFPTQDDEGVDDFPGPGSSTGASRSTTAGWSRRSPTRR